MLAAGTIRRIRQTLMATNLARGALVAWRIPGATAALDAAFDYMVRDDPFSGHVVIRSTDADTPGSAFKLWSTLKVPQGFSLRRHCEVLGARVGAEDFRIMPAHRLFALGVGHVRRQPIVPGSKTDEDSSSGAHSVRDLGRSRNFRGGWLGVCPGRGSGARGDRRGG